MVGIVFGLLSAVVLLVFLVVDDFRANRAGASTAGYGCMVFVMLGILGFALFIGLLMSI